MSDWRDIASAPKDGTDILVFCSDTREMMVAYWTNDGWCFALWNDRSRVVCHPSHWMPLPTPPEQEK